MRHRRRRGHVWGRLLTRVRVCGGGIGREQDIGANRRVQRVLAEIRARAGERRAHDGSVTVRREDWPAYRVHIVSVNSFPTAAGLASSAAGYACLSECCCCASAVCGRGAAADAAVCISHCICTAVGVSFA